MGVSERSDFRILVSPGQHFQEHGFLWVLFIVDLDRRVPGAAYQEFLLLEEDYVGDFVVFFPAFDVLHFVGEFRPRDFRGYFFQVLSVFHIKDSDNAGVISDVEFPLLSAEAQAA